MDLDLAPSKLPINDHTHLLLTSSSQLETHQKGLRLKKKLRENFSATHSTPKKSQRKFFSDSLDSQKNLRENFSATHLTPKKISEKNFQRHTRLQKKSQRNFFQLLTRLQKKSQRKFFNDSLDSKKNLRENFSATHLTPKGRRPEHSLQTWCRPQGVSLYFYPSLWAKIKSHGCSHEGGLTFKTQYERPTRVSFGVSQFKNQPLSCGYFCKKDLLRVALEYQVV